MNLIVANLTSPSDDGGILAKFISPRYILHQEEELGNCYIGLLPFYLFVEIYPCFCLRCHLAGSRSLPWDLSSCSQK